MPPRDDDDWSDEDEEEVLDTVTSVQLGVPDGTLDSQTDLHDAAVSRIGGLPAFLTSPEPPFESSLCKNCSTPMELIVQVWCPMEDSPHDRALYVWACSRGVCQGLKGSVRAFRGLRFNEKYAAKLAKQKARRGKQETHVQDAKPQAAKSNPFSLGGGTFAATPNPFGLGSQVFGAQDSEQPEEKSIIAEENLEDTHLDQEEDSETDENEVDDEELVTAMASSTLEATAWASAPSYPALYLSTVPEYIPPAPKTNPKIVEVSEHDHDGKTDKDISWAMEGYENSLDVDHAFERFSKRVGYEAEQCIRYELGGIPLPFASDDVFDELFPEPPALNLPVTKPSSMVVPQAKRTYDPSAIPVCAHCKSKRVFECQLMPNLINILRNKNAAGPTKPQTDEERRKEIEAMLNVRGSIEQTGMGWGTCLVFSCEKDCCEENGAPLTNCWREEVVLVQWDR